MTDVLSVLPRPRHCRVCGCTETTPCPGGCAWVAGEHDLCDGKTCHLFVLAPSFMTARAYVTEYDLPGWKWTFLPPFEMDRYLVGVRFPVIAKAAGWEDRIDRREVARVLAMGMHRDFPIKPADQAKEE